MVKRTLSFVLILTVLASCLIGLPVMASTTEAITDITAGGAFTENIAMTNDEFLSAPNFVESSTISYSKSGDTNIVGTITQNGDVGWVNFADAPELKNAGKPGTHVAVIQGTVALTNNDWSKLKTVEMQVLPYLDSSNTVAQASSDWSSLRNNSEANGLYMGPGADYKILEPYTNEEVDIKYVYTFTDGETAGTKNVSMTPSFRLSGQNEWTEVTTATTTKKGVANATIGKIRLRFRLSGKPTEAAVWKLKNFSVVEPTPADAAIAELGGKTYEANAVVPLDYVLPVGYKSAKISVGGVDVKTLTDAAGAYKANLNLAAVSASGNVEITLSGVGADDVAFSKTTKIYVPTANSGSLNTALLTQPTPGGKWAEREVVSGADFLASTTMPEMGTTSNVNYDKATATAHQKGYNSLKFADFTSLRMNDEDNATLEIMMDVTMPMNPADIFAEGTVNYTEFVHRFTTYIDGVANGTSSGYYGLNVRYNNGKVTLSYPRGSNTRDYVKDTTVAVKYVIEKKDGIISATNYVSFDGRKTWLSDPNGKISDRKGNVTGVGILYGLNNTPVSGSLMKWAYSNASVKEPAPKNVCLSDLSVKSYLPTESETVDFVLPEGYRNAELTIGTTKAASFEGAITKAGGYTATINMAEVKQTGTIPVVLSGTLEDGSAFKAETTVYIQKAGAGSLDEELFSKPTYSADKTVMTNADVLDRTVSGFTYSYDSADQSATVHNSGTWQTRGKFLDFPTLRLNEVENGSVEINMDIEVKPGSADTYPEVSSNNWSRISFNPYLDGTVVRTAGGDRTDSGLLYFVRNEYSEAPNKDYDSIAYFRNIKDQTSYAKAEGTKIPVKILITKENGTITFTQQAKFGDTWVTDTTGKRTTTGTGDLTGLELWLGQNSADTENYVAWEISNVTVVDNSDFVAELADMSDVLYTQYDNGKVPVEFVLPSNYKDASISVDGKDVTEFTNVSHPAGAYKSEIDLSKLDFALTHSVVLEGTMGDGTTFTKKTNTAAIAATEGVDEVDSQLETPTTAEIANVTGTCDAFVLTGKAYVKKELAGCYWSNYDTVSTPDGPFLSQYITELTADVDFTNAVPTLSLIAGRTAEGENYSDGFNVPIDVELPQKAFKLMVRSYTIHPETGYGDTTYAFVYADGQYIGSTVYTQTSARSMGDHYGYMTLAFGKPAGYANETIGIKNLTWNKYSAGVAKAELGATPKTVIVTFDKDMDEASAEFITLVDKEGTKVEAEVEVAGKTATITATDDIPAYASVVIGAGVKEADYEFDAYFNPIATKTRLGEALTKGYTIKLNNTPTKTEVYAMTSSKSGNTITAEIELFAPAAEEAIGSLIVAAYDENGVLQALDTQEVVAEEAGEATLTIDVPLSGDFASYKVFLWSDVSGTMIPILPVE